MFPQIQPFGSKVSSSLRRVYSRQATESVNCENSSVSFVIKYCPTSTVVRNPASVQNLLNLSCCDNFSIRSPYLCNRKSLCAGSSLFKDTFVLICKSGKRRKSGAKCAVHKDENCFLLGSDLSSRRLCEKRNVTVMFAVTGCDVTTVQQHNTGSTSTPPRVARRCQIREASLVALRKISKNLLMLTCVDRSTRPIHHTRIQRFPLSFVATVPFAR